MFFIFTIAYILLAGCMIYPPTEFISAGFTIESLYAKYLGSENVDFIDYHRRRSVFTMIIHSLIPLGYVIGLMFNYEDVYLTEIFGEDRFLIREILITSVVAIPVTLAVLIVSWLNSNWNDHPIARNLAKFANENQKWNDVASDINIEFRRVDKICIQTNSINKIIATDNWIMKITPYTINLAHQSDAVLVVIRSDTHEISHTSDQGEVQFVDIQVEPKRPNIKPFTIRLNALDFKDLQDKISRPITVLSEVKFHKTLLERFIDVFKEEVKKNPESVTNRELELCIGCMQNRSNVKLMKNCDDQDCVNCYCTPMWCLDCMAKWFASRQDQADSSNWLHSKCTCPLCRSNFCLLDVTTTRTEIE